MADILRNNEDDAGNDYLLSRQVAHEYHSAPMQSYINSFSRQMQEPPAGQLEKTKAESDLKRTTGKTVEEVEKGGLEEPMLDPVGSASGGFAGTGVVSLRQGMKLMPALGRAILAGIVGGVADYPIGAATEAIEPEYPELALPFNVVTGLISGATLENAIETGVRKGLGKIANESPELVSRFVNDIRFRLASETGSIGRFTKGGNELAEKSGVKYIGEADGLEYFNVQTPKGETTIATKGLDETELTKRIEETKKLFEAKVTKGKDGEYLIEETDLSEEQKQSVLKSVVQTLNDTIDNEIGAVGDIKNIRKRLEGATDVKAELSKIQKEQINVKKHKMLVAVGARKSTDVKSEPTIFTEGLSDLELKDKAININFKNVETEDDIKRIMQRVGEIYEPEIQDARRNVVTNKNTKLLANLFGMTPEQLLLRRKGQAFNANESLSARRILVSSAENLHELAQKIANTTTATQEDMFEFRKAMNLHYAIQAQVSGMTAEAGRALQAFKISAGSTEAKTRQIKELLSTAPGMSIEKMAQHIATIDTVEGLTQAVPKMVRATTKDMFLEIWINGLLSGPHTHIINSLSNSLNAVWQVPERFLAAMLGRVLPGEQVIKETEALQQAYGLVEGFKDGLKAFSKVARTGQASDELTKLEAARYRAITAENVRQLPVIKKMAPNALQEGGISARAVDFMGETVRLPGRFLMAEDELFKAVGYRMELRAQAFRMASEEGLIGEARARRMAEIMRDPETLAPNIHLAAVDASRYATFTNPLKSEILVALSRSKNPVVRLIVPFVRTPTNIFKYAFERTPFALTSNKIRADILAGGARRDLALARISMGSVLMSTAAIMAAEGKITGGGPSDPNLRANLVRQGWKPYSLKIGNKYVQYGRLEPLGMVFGLAADFSEITGLAGEELAPEVDNLASAITMAVSKNVTSKTWLRGISEAVQAMDDQDRYGNRYIQNYARSLVPAVVAQAERTIDPETEAVYGLVDSMKSRIPGLSKDLPPRRNLWGEPITTQIGSGERSWAEIAYSAISPIYVSEGKESQIDKELTRLKLGVSKPGKKQDILGVPVDLTPKLYDDYLQLMNEDFYAGKSLKQTLNEIVRSPDYKGLTDDQKREQIRDVFTKAKRKGKAKLIEKYPDILNAVTAWRQRLSAGDQ